MLSSCIFHLSISSLKGQSSTQQSSQSEYNEDYFAISIITSKHISTVVLLKSILIFKCCYTLKVGYEQKQLDS